MFRTSLLVTAALFAACQGPDHDAVATSQPTEAHTGGKDLSVKVASPVPGWDAYGSAFDATKVDKVVTFADIAADPAAFDGQDLTVRATISEVCQTKGCWMTFGEDAESMRVKFQDYAFFMPLDAAGREVIVDGKFSIDMVPVEEERHYLEDAGRFDEAAALTEDVRKMNFMATAVLMR